jgi:cold shock CspA family protein
LLGVADQDNIGIDMAADDANCFPSNDHLSAILASGFLSLRDGQQVQCDMVKGPKGWQAGNATDA